MSGDRAKHQTILIFILLVALVLRLLFALSQNHLAVYEGTGGDNVYYLVNGAGLLSGQEHGMIRGIGFYNSQIPTAPLYLIYTGIWQQLLPDETAVILMRIFQVLMSVAICYFAYRIAWRITGDERAGLISAFVLAVSPAFVMDAAQIATETMYIFFLTAGMFLYLEIVVPNLLEPEKRVSWLVLAMVGVAFGLTTLTRAVSLLFPLLIAAHLLILTGRKHWGKGLASAGWLLVFYFCVVGIWTVTNLVRWDEPRFLIGSDRIWAVVYKGTFGRDTSPQEVDESLIDPELIDPDCEVDCKYQTSTDTYVEKTVDVIAANPMEYIQRRAGEWLYANLQPYGTIFLGGESLRDLASDWLQNNPDFDGFVRLVQGDNFVLKIVIYLFHYVGVIGGIIGVWVLRKNWRYTLPIVLFILYTLAIHVVFDVEPRYIFPTQTFFWILAPAALLAFYGKIRTLRFGRGSDELNPSAS